MQGDVYTYNIVATDPANTTVTYQLAAGPAGAAIAENVLTWTPSQAQVCKANQFLVTAATAAGGFATQLFTVTPAGIVHGTKITTYVSDAGESDVPADLTAVPIRAWIPDGSGSYTQIEGCGDANGNFSVPWSAIGNYLMQVGKDYLWTSATNTDFGQYHAGRPGVATTSGLTKLNLSLSNAYPYSDSDLIYVTSPNAGAWEGTYPYPATAGSTNLNWIEDWGAAPLLDSTKGDQVYVEQLRSVTTQTMSPQNGAYTVNVLARLSEPQSIIVQDGTTTALPATLNDVGTGSSVRMNIDGLAFRQIGTASSPAAGYSTTSIFVSAYPYGGQYGPSGATIDFVTYFSQQGAITTAVDLGEVTFGNPVPTWTKVAVFSAGSLVRYNVPATANTPAYTSNVSAAVNAYTTTLPTVSEPVQPLIGNVVSPTINGEDFFADQSGIGNSPVVSWTAPSLGTPTGYRVLVYALTKPAGTVAGAFYTTDTSIVLPPGVLSSSVPNSIVVTAVRRGSLDFTTAPLRDAFPHGEASVLSGKLTP